LILGGYDVFCGRLAQLLADLPYPEMVIAGRDARKAAAFCRDRTGQATVRPLGADRRDIAVVLATLQPDLIVDASGPFQAYGIAAYGVVEAAIAQGMPYLDFADGSDFVLGIGQFDSTAGVFVLSGVSSFPVLSFAVLTEMAKTMTIRKVQDGIAPSPYAGVGMNVMRAVLGYAGQPAQLRRNGAEAFGIGLAESLRYTVAVPGKVPLHPLRFSLVDAPGLCLIPAEIPGVTDIWMGAGPVPELLHRLLNVLAKARYLLRLPTLTPLAPLCYRGGMFIEATDDVAGRRVTRAWHLLAEGDDGPMIPSMAVEGLVRQMLAGAPPAIGARSALSALNLADYEALFKRRAIATGWRDEHTAAAPYRRVLGPAFDGLAAQLASPAPAGVAQPVGREANGSGAPKSAAPLARCRASVRFSQTHRRYPCHGHLHHRCQRRRDLGAAF
jgi:hypothetical protein